MIDRAKEIGKVIKLIAEGKFIIDMHLARERMHRKITAELIRQVGKNPTRRRYDAHRNNFQIEGLTNSGRLRIVVTHNEKTGAIVVTGMWI